MKKRTFVFMFVPVFLLSAFVNGSDKNVLVLKTGELEDIINIKSFLMNGKSEIFLFSPKLSKVFKFRPDGTFEKSFCRKGEGPGEINRVFHMFHNPNNDFLYLPEYYSMGKGKITIYDSNGNHKGLLTPEISITHLDRVSRLFFLKDNSYIIVTDERVSWKPVGKFFVTQDEILVRYFNADGKLISTIFKTLLDGELSNAVRYGGPQIPFSPSLRVNTTPDRNVAVAKTDENIISIYHTSGKKIRTITLDIPKEKLTQELFNKEKELIINEMKRYNDGRLVMLAKNMIKLDYIPIFDYQFFTPDLIVLSTIIEKDEAGYPLKNKLIYFSWNGKKKGEKIIEGIVKSRHNDKALIIRYDSEGNEAYRIEPGIFSLKK